jgi:hypothetical protein
MNFKINKQFLLDLVICGFFTVVSMTIIGFIIPEGVTSKFLFRGSKIVILVLVIISIILLIYWFFDTPFKVKKKISLPNLKDFLLLAFPMSPVINYALINLGYLDFNGLFYLIGMTLVFSIFFSIIFPIFFSYFASYNILMISGVAISFAVLTMAKISYNPSDHILNSQFLTQGLYLIISFIVLYFLYLFNKRITYTVVILFMISGSGLYYREDLIINFYERFQKKTKVQENTNKIEKFLNNNNNKIIEKKNIYILIYESYANLETLNYYGFDNIDQINFLKKKGFTVYDGIYSNASTSLESTSRILEIEGELFQPVRYYTSGNAFALDLLKANGYKTKGLFSSSYYFDSTPISWDEYHPKADVTKTGGRTLTKSIFKGEFGFNDIFDGISYDEYLELKKKYLESSEKSTLFYSHNKYPGHSQNSGKCRLNEKEIYFKGMKKANIEMKNDIFSLIKNDPNSIIVLLGDHGPYLTKNCRELRKYDVNTIDKYDLQDRYGTFLSIHWPKDIPNIEQNIMITQDIFPAILSNITNNKNLFNELKVERKFFDGFMNKVNGVNVLNGIIKGGKDDGKALFDKRSYLLTN